MKFSRCAYGKTDFENPFYLFFGMRCANIPKSDRLALSSSRWQLPESRTFSFCLFYVKK